MKDGFAKTFIRTVITVRIVFTRSNGCRSNAVNKYSTITFIVGSPTFSPASELLDSKSESQSLPYIHSTQLHTVDARQKNLNHRLRCRHVDSFATSMCISRKILHLQASLYIPHRVPSTARCPGKEPRPSPKMSTRRHLSQPLPFSDISTITLRATMPGFPDRSSNSPC